MANNAAEIGALTGRVVEVGRGGDTRNSVSIDAGHGQIIMIDGISDTVTKQFAANLYKYVSIEVTVQNDG